jgi:RsiW-degrading membrane proteinase PrsW (M82 family)
MCVHVGQTRRFLWLACAALLWTLWNLRKKFTIGGVFPAHPSSGLYTMTMYLQVWKLLARREDRQAVELVIGKTRALHASIRDSD